MNKLRREYLSHLTHRERVAEHLRCCGDWMEYSRRDLGTYQKSKELKDRIDTQHSLLIFEQSLEDLENEINVQ